MKTECTAQTKGFVKTKVKVFIDGRAGTTGLKIFDSLAQHPNIQLLQIDEEKRKAATARQALINASDITFLCLPDTASRESVALVDNSHTCIIDTSTAFRTHQDWVYGLPELNQAQRARIRGAKRIAVPGCHASAFVLSVQPLIAQRILPSDCPLACYSITGYSGGGQQMINDYEQAINTDGRLSSPRPYALHLMHKHLPEMKMHAGLTAPPIFTPIVANFYQGLAVTTYFHPQYFTHRIGVEDLYAALAKYYQDEPFIHVTPLEEINKLDRGFFDIQACNGTNRVDLFIFGNQERMIIMARLDNLGKGAAGAAIQCMNLHMGVSESEGLER